MKRFKTSITRGTDVQGSEVRKRILRNESPQTIRNISRIEQLEAQQTDFDQRLKGFEEVLLHFQLSPWTSLGRHSPSWWKSVGMPDIIFERNYDLQSQGWVQIFKSHRVPESVSERPTIPYHDELSTLTKLFRELKEDFDEVTRRIVRCELLEKRLATLESSLEDEETEYLGWCISLIRDVLDYNYAEDLTKTHLELLEKAIDLICKKGSNCNKGDYQDLHKEFLQAGAALIPTTQKAIDKYGE